MAARDNIKVVARFRPFNELERTKGCPCAVESLEDTSVRLKTVDKNTYTFNYDRCFATDSDQVSVYNYVAQPLIEGLFQGFNCALLAYGQTGSGKTHSMMGPGMDVDDDNRGIIPRAVQAIFDQVLAAGPSYEYTICVSFIEIYCEKIRDLLLEKANPSAPPLQVVEDDSAGGNGVHVKGARVVDVTSVEEVFALMKLGNMNRATAATAMNAQSSRSHSLFLLNIKQRDLATDTATHAKFYLVDLAGNEDLAKTRVVGQQEQELKAINKSLLTLGLVINALTEKGRTHVPYRDSKLTRILQECLGGNARTALILTCSPASWNEKETLMTLRFGQRAKEIVNKAVVNKELGLDDTRRYAKVLERLVGAFVEVSGEWLGLYAGATAASGPSPEGVAAGDRTRRLVKEATQLLADAGVAAPATAAAAGGSAPALPALAAAPAPAGTGMGMEEEDDGGGDSGAAASHPAAAGELGVAYASVAAERDALARERDELVDVLQLAQEELVRLRGAAATRSSAGDDGDGDEAMTGGHALPSGRTIDSSDSTASLLSTIQAQEEEIEGLKELLGAAREALAATRRASYSAGATDAATVAALTANCEAARAENASLQTALAAAQERLAGLEAALAAATAAGVAPSPRAGSAAHAGTSTEALDRLASAQRRVLELTSQTQERDTLLRELTQELASKNNTISEYEYRLRAVMDQMAEAAATGDLRHIGQSSSVIHVVSEPEGGVGGAGRPVSAVFAPSAASGSSGSSSSIPSASSPVVIHRTIRGGGGGGAHAAPPLSPGGSLVVDEDNSSFLARLVRRFSSSPTKASVVAAGVTAGGAPASSRPGVPSTSAAAAPAAAPSSRVTGSDFLTAAERGDVSVVSEYLRSGSRGVHVEDRDGRTAVMYAARGAAIAVLQVLHAAGANLSAADKDGRCALHYAARRGHAEVVAWLAGHGASVDVKDAHALQPLHQAVLAWSPATVRVLLQAGADPTARDSNGNTPARLARRFAERPDANRDDFAAIAALLEAAEAARGASS